VVGALTSGGCGLVRRLASEVHQGTSDHPLLFIQRPDYCEPAPISEKKAVSRNPQVDFHATAALIRSP
jgi:hypothetical protein